MNKNVRFSSRLYARPSILSGVARVLDMGGLFDAYNTSGSEREADRLALESDWRSVGSDLKEALQEQRQSRT